MNNRFTGKLRAVQAETSIYGLYIAPKLETLPPEIAYYDDPFLPYARAILAATQDLVCAYVFDFAAYLALGAAGAIALERSINLMANRRITVLDARFADAMYANVWDEGAFAVDAVTLAPEAPRAAYQSRDDRQAFVLSDGNVPQNASFRLSADVFTMGDDSIQLLPPDTLYRARSLEFEATLREVVMTHVKH